MCEWFKPQYRELVRQFDRLGFNLLEASNDWTVGQIQAQADNVAANIDQTENYLAPRAQALTQAVDPAGDTHSQFMREKPSTACGRTSLMSA